MGIGKKRLLIIVAISVSVLVFLVILFVNSIQGSFFTPIQYSNGVPVRSVLINALNGRSMLTETIGVIELENSAIYIWKTDDNTIMLDYLILDEGNKGYEDSETYGMTIQDYNKFKTGWLVMTGPEIDITNNKVEYEPYPVAINLTSIDVQSQRYEGQIAQYKDFSATIDNTQHTFRAFYMELNETSPSVS
jgi:hypothetical protein